MSDFLLLLATASATASGPKSQKAAEGLTRALPWTLLIITATVVLVVLAFWLKRQFFPSPERSVDEQAGGFSLSYLRKMHAAGEISDEEFEKTRERIVSKAQKRIAEEAEQADERAAIQPGQPRTKDVDLIRDAE